MAVKEVKYSSKIIKASALIPDTKMLISQWDITKNSDINLKRIREENVFGKSTRSRINDILAIFKQRYLSDAELLPALKILLDDDNFPPEDLDSILYYQAAQSDLLLHDSIIQVLLPCVQNGKQIVTVSDIKKWIRAQIMQGKTHGSWDEKTITRAAQGILSTLRDFRILKGKVNKTITPIYLSNKAFAFIAFLLNKQHKSGYLLLHSQEWKLYFLSDLAVERFFLEAHQEGLLKYHAAGSIIRIEFPVNTLEEYAYVIAKRKY